MLMERGLLNPHIVYVRGKKAFALKGVHEYSVLTALYFFKADILFNLMLYTI